MATQQTPLLDWLVQVPDLPGVQARRGEHLDAHLAYQRPQIAAGQLVLSGPMVEVVDAPADAPADEQHPPEEQPRLTGSILVLRAPSAAEVWRLLHANPYARAGVWDLGRAAVTPFRCAVRTAL